jgi:glycosyltransferase involved in cell wall biosynthesis
MPLKILIVTNMYPTPEAVNWGTFIQHQVHCLQNLGHNVQVYYVNGRKSIFNYLFAVFKVFFKTLCTRYDIVHAHHGLSGVISLLRVRTPLVTTFHGSDVLLGKIQPFLSRIAFKFSDASIVVSDKIGTIVPGTVIPCGVDTTVFKPMANKEARLKVGFPSSGKIVLFPFDPMRRLKRYDLAEAAVEILKKRGYSLWLRSVWNAQNEMMPLYYAAADVMILCSDSEGSPTSIKEALSCNIPVVATDVGDVAQIIEGIEGTMLCRQSALDLAQGIENVLYSKKNSNFDGRSAMIRKYDQLVIINKILGIYQSVKPS